MKVYTIGVYGCTEGEFFHSLAAVHPDLFCDIRLRRGMRGKTYSFVNSNYLQQKLKELGIPYVHRKDLAPPQSIRDLQKENDRQENVQKRDRTRLSDEFITAYRSRILSAFDPAAFVKQIGAPERFVLFCVEDHPAACHRSLVADQLHDQLGIEVEHLIPCKS